MKKVKAWTWGNSTFWALFIGIALSLTAASPTLINRNGQVVTPTGNAAFGGPMEIYYQAVPTSLTDVSARDAHITTYVFHNSTAGPLTITIQTKDASPLPLPLSGLALQAGADAYLILNGLLSKGGFSWQSSGTGMYGYVQFTN